MQKGDQAVLSLRPGGGGRRVGRVVASAFNSSAFACSDLPILRPHAPSFKTRDSRLEGGEVIRFTRDQLLQLREVVKISDDILWVKKEVEAEFFGDDQNWNRVENNNGLIPRSKGASVITQHVAAPTKVLVDPENIPESVDMGVKEKHLVQNSVIHAEGTSNDGVISSKGNTDFGLWRGHEVNSEFVCLLDLIIDKYPETFKDFTAKSKRFCTMKLNMLCTSINDFTKISVAEVNTEMIVEYRNVFADLQDWGFNLSWLVSRLDYIEQLRFSQPLIPQLHAIDCHIDDAKTKLKDLENCVNDTKSKLQGLQTRRAEKMQEIQKAFGTMATNLAVGNIGDHLFSAP